MAFLDHNGESEFPMSKDKVFEAMRKAIPTIDGLKIESADKLQGRFVVKAGVSLYSWGENIPIQLSEISENRTKVQITSSPKTGIMFGGAFDMGKNRKNIENILSSTSRILSAEMESMSSGSESVPLENKPFPSEPKRADNSQQTRSQTNQSANVNANKSSDPNAWYEKTWLVTILCIVFFPVGLYALWKNSSIKKGWKIAITIIISLIVLSNLSDDVQNSSTESEAEIETGIESGDQSNSTETIDDTDSEKEAIIAKLKAVAEKDWPNDYVTQEFWIEEQIDAYEYMLTIEDNSIKKQAQRDWPLDFTTQKFWYDEQIAAKERMQ